MSIIKIMLAVFALMLPLNYSFGQSDSTQNMSGRCGGPYLIQNFNEFFCVKGYEPNDSAKTSLRTDSLGAMVLDRFPDYFKGFAIDYIYSIHDHDNLIFIGLSSTSDPNGGYFNIALNKRQNQYYLLNFIEPSSVANLLEDELAPSDTLDGQILLYCYLFSILQNSIYRFKPISSVNEIIVNTVISNPYLYNFYRAEGYENIEVSRPNIQKTDSLTYVEFNAAKRSNWISKLLKINFTLKNNRVLDYKQSELSDLPDWR